MTAKDICKEFEQGPLGGVALKAYKCPSGIWTCGWGHTAGVGPEATCDEALAEKWLDDDLRYSYSIVDEWVKLPLAYNQRESVASFVFNVGPGVPGKKDGFVWLKRLKNGSPQHSTMLRCLNAGNMQGASAEFLKWVYGGGKVLAGLSRRRKMEKALFDTPEEM